MRFHRSAALVLAAACAAAACGGESSGAANAAGGPPAQGRQGGGAPGAGGRGGAPSLTLSASDVAVARRASIEAGTPVTGNLNPAERVDVRARLEGDLVGVYVREGERVRTGQLLARIESSQQESGSRSAAADREAARAEVTTAEWSHEQTEELYKAGAVPERDMRSAQQQLVAARARLAAAESRVRATSNELRDTYVRSPIDGVVESRAVEGAEHVSRGASLLTVVRTDVLELAAAVPARLAGDVRTGQRVRFQADGRRFEGTVARMSPTVDAASRSVMVYVRVPNDGTLRGGSFASGQIVGRTKADALVVPSAAVRQGQQGASPFVWRIASRQLDQAPVRLGIVDDVRGLSEVVEGLAEGDRVVAGNVGTVGRGMQVEVLGADTREAGGREQGAGGGAATAPLPRPRS